MKSVSYYLAIRAQKRVETLEKKLIKFKYYVKQVNKWIKEEKKVLQKHLDNLSINETYSYGIKTGWLEKNHIKVK